MKCLFALPVLLLFACTERSPTVKDEQLAKSCTCDERLAEDTIFFATNVRLQEVEGKKMIHYNCAAVVIGTASVTGEDGAEHCENLYELECVSPVKASLALSDSFTYFTEEMKPMKMSSTGARNLFFEALKRKQTQYFEFTVVNKELKAISKINMQ